MTSLTVADSNRIVAEHQQVLRDYAKRVILNCQVLGPEEDDDLAHRMQEFYRRRQLPQAHRKRDGVPDTEALGFDETWLRLPELPGTRRGVVFPESENLGR